MGTPQPGRRVDAAEPVFGAAAHFRLAREIDPEDQQSWFGYGQAMVSMDKGKEADSAFLKTVEIDEFSDIAERARQARTKLAGKSFRSAAPGVYNYPSEDLLL